MLTSHEPGRRMLSNSEVDVHFTDTRDRRKKNCLGGTMKLYLTVGCLTVIIILIIIVVVVVVEMVLREFKLRLKKTQ